MKKFALILGAFASSCTQAQPNRFTSAGMEVQLVQVVSGKDIIWGMDFLPNHHIIFTQRKGDLEILNPVNGEVTAIEGVPEVAKGGQGGLLDVKLHPDFAKNSWVYLTYSVKVPPGRTTRLARFKLSGNELTQAKVLFTGDTASNEDVHFGSRIAFDGKGYVFFSVGERGQRDLAQDLSKHNGKILRLHDDGAIPKDNPFLNSNNAKPEIWSYGHRNPQGLYWDAKTGILWENEHGPRGGDEINRVEKGKNYGWPIITHGHEYHNDAPIGEGTEKTGIEKAVKVYIPSIAPCGLTVYRGKKLAAWDGNLFSGALALMHLNRIALNADSTYQSEERLFEKKWRVRNVVTGPDELLYFSTDDGSIFRLEPVRKNKTEGLKPGPQ